MTAFTPTTQNEFDFLRGGSEMGEYIKTLDWSETAIGSPGNWPQSLRTILNVMLHSKFPMFLYWGPEFTCFYNDAFRPSLGTDGKHPGSLGKPASAFWAEVWHDLEPNINRIKAGGSSAWHEDKLVPIYRNGQIENVYWTYSYSPVINESGEVGGTLVTCIETTRQVLTLAQLRESADELSFAIEATELATWDVNPLTNKLKGNERLKEWFGLAAEDEVELQDALDVIAEQDRARVSAAIERAYQYDSGGKYDTEYTIINPVTKQERYVRAKGRVWYTDNQEAYRFNGTLQDLTMEVQARRRIEESESRFRRMIEAAPFPIAVYSGREMRVQSANQAVFDAWGKGNNVIGKRLADILPELESQEIFNLLDQVYTTGVPFHAENQPIDLVVNGKLQTYYFDNNFTPLFDTSGKVFAIMNTAANVTDLVLAEQKLQHTANELAAANRDLLTSHQQLQESNEKLTSTVKELSLINADMDNFIYAASHDLRAPISNIEGLMTLIMEELPNANRNEAVMQEVFGLIMASIERFKQTIRDLTDISKLQREEAENQIQVDLAQMIRDVQLDLSNQIKESQAQIDLDLEACTAVNFSPKNARSVVYNLLSNSIKYRSSDRPLRISISCYQEGDYQVLAVQDNGLGMDLTDESKVFGMFKRLHDHVEGSGVGLYIVKKIMENAGGKIKVESKVGEGSTFKVYFLQNYKA